MLIEQSPLDFLSYAFYRSIIIALITSSSSTNRIQLIKGENEDKSMRKIENKPRLLFGIFFLIFPVYIFLSDGSALQLLIFGPTGIWFISDSIFGKKSYLNRNYHPGAWTGTLFLGIMITYIYVFQPVYAKDPVFYIFPIFFVFLSGIGVYEHRRIRKYQKAAESYEKALKLNPEDAAAWNNKGTVIAGFKAFQEAINCFENAIEINPKDGAAWYNKGVSLMELGKLQEAIEYYNTALKVDPGFKNAKESGEIILKING